MNWRGGFHRVHFALSRSRVITRMALAFRNQFGAVVAARVAAPTCQGEGNGEQFLARSLAPGCEFFIDVGANVGEWTDSMLVANGNMPRGLLFEPNHATFVELHKKYAAQRNLTPIEAAVSDYDGEADFFEEAACGRTSSLSGVNARPDAIRRKVRITTLDHEVEACGWPRVDLLKIDAEGHDFYVLRGARRLLEKGKISVLQFEYSMESAATGATLAGAYNFLEAFGYRVFILRPDGLYDFNVRRYGETFAYANFVAVRRDRQQAIAALIRGDW